MPEELKSFLISVSVILTLALFIPCIESLTKLIRRNAQRQTQPEVAAIKTSKRYRGEAA